MVEWSKMNKWIQENFDFIFNNICISRNITFKKDDMNLISKIIKDNPYPLLNSEYAPILLLEIKRKTNLDVYNKMKVLLSNNILLDAIYEQL